MVKKHLLYLNRENDVAAIDINMGCPKEFSVQVRKMMFSKLFKILFRANFILFSFREGWARRCLQSLILSKK